MLQQIIKNPNKFAIVFLGLLVIIVCLSYYPALLVPFYLDDVDSIVENTLVRSEVFSLPTQIEVLLRVVGYWTLWVNYQIGELDPAGYHIVNIAIHCINILLVYGLALAVIRSAKHFTAGDENPAVAIGYGQACLLALCVATLWGLHPLNSQTVIYVVQRLASIAALFYLLTALCYIQLRMAQHLPQKIIFVVLMLIAVVLGVFTKQNFVTVFLFLLVWELMYCQAKTRKIIGSVMLITIFVVLLLAPFFSAFLTQLDGLTRDTYALSRGHYFYSQTLVLWDYMWRFIWPFSLQLDIDSAAKTSFEPMVALALLGHMAVATFAFKVRRQIPLVFIGILMFYTSHGIESFIIPIKDLSFEHRTYIGNVGLCIAVVGALQYGLAHRLNTLWPTIVKYGAAVVLVGFAMMIYQRAVLWQDPLTFYANEVDLAPEHPRSNGSYGTELMKLQRFTEAEPYLKKSVDINIAHQRATASSLIAYMTVLYHQQKYQQAAPVVMVALKYIQYPLDRSMLLGNLGFGYIQMGYCDFAANLLKTALALNPDNTDAQTNLNYCLQRLAPQ